MKKILLLTTLSTSLLLSNDISINSLGLNLGTSNTNYSKKDTQGSIILGNDPDKSFNSFEVFTTLNPISSLCKKNNMKPYFSYTYSKNSELKHQYILAGVNRYYKHNSLDFYAGVLGGYGQMKWRYDPLNSSTSKNIDANSFIAGLQAGTNYPLSNTLSLGINTKFLVHDYETKLEPSAGVSSTIKHDSTFNISLG